MTEETSYIVGGFSPTTFGSVSLDSIICTNVDSLFSFAACLLYVVHGMNCSSSDQDFLYLKNLKFCMRSDDFSH